MRLIHPEPAEALLGLRAMKTVASSTGAIGPSQRALMEAARQVVLRIDVDIDALDVIEPESFAAGFPDEALRRQFVNGLLVVALADGVPSPAAMSSVEGFARALGIDTPELRDLRLLAQRHMVLFRLDFWRHGHIGDMMRNQLDRHGILGLAKGVLGLRGLVEDKELAAKYRAWERLPQDTLGHAVWQYYQTNGFAFPGERTGFPEAGLYHDFSHVLGGYDTDPPGEIQVAAFTAGYKQYRPVYVVLFAVLIFSTGVDMRPAPGYSRTSILAEPGMATRMFAALERGGAVRVDLSDQWDYWPYVELSLAEARQRLGISPAAPV